MSKARNDSSGNSGTRSTGPPPQYASVAREAAELEAMGFPKDGEGWFIVNARDSRWRDEGRLGSYCTFEGKRRFPHLGINISVLNPGEIHIHLAEAARGMKVKAAA